MSSKNWTTPEQIPVEIKDMYRHHHCIYPHPKDDAVEQALDRLVIKLRTAGLLLTPGEKQERDITMSEVGVAIRGDATLITRLRAENDRLRDALAKIGEWLLIHDLTIVDKMKQVTAALGAEHE